VRPTLTGWSALSAGVALYTVGVALGYPELVVGGAALLLLVVAAFGWVVREPHLDVTRHVEPPRVRRREAALGMVKVTNTGRHRSPRLLVEDRAGTATVTIEVPPLAGRRTGAQALRAHRATYRIPTDRRGQYDMGPLVLSQSDPFGLVARRRAVGDRVPLWVHPRTHPVPASPVGASLEVDGPMDDTAPEGSIAFQGLRPYIVGDDLRLVHWRTTARTGTLMVKKHVDTSRPQVAVLLDDRAYSYPDPDAFEEAVDVAASLVEQAMRAEAPVRIDLVSGMGEPSVPITVTNALDYLARIPLRAGQPGTLTRTVTVLEGELGGSAALLVSGARLNESVTALDRLATRYRRVSALLVGADEAGARAVGSLEVCRAGSAAELLRAWRAGSRV
jgi:uncharacterized protein (DUF58 family)